MIYYATLLAHVSLLALMGAAAGWVRHLSRQLLLCLGGFAGVGAYVTAILTTRFEAPPIAALLIGGFAGCGCGAVLGLVAWRVRGAGFVLVLLAVQVFFQEAVYPLRAWTSGSDGINGIPSLLNGGFVGRAWATVAIAAVLTLVAVWWLKRVKTAPIGLLGRAFGDNPNEFAAHGFDARFPLLWTYSLSGLFSGLAGGLLATTTGLVTPGEIGFALSVTAAVVVLLPIEVWVGDYLAPFAAALCVVGIRNLVEAGFARFLAHDASWFWHAQVFREMLVGGLFLWLLVPARPPRPYHETVATPIDHDRALSLLALDGPLEPTTTPICSLSGVSVRCSGQVLLPSISFDAWPGSVIALVGPNGSGKTTALLALQDKYIPDEGRVGRPRLDAIGYLSGSDRPFHGLTALENLRLYRSRAEDQGMMASLIRPEEGSPQSKTLLDALGIGHRKHALGQQLSWGQSRRLMLAGLLSQKPWKLLLLDEPASGLDVATRDFLAVVIRRVVQKDRAVVVAEHDLWFVQKVATQIISVGATHDVHQPNMKVQQPAGAPKEPILRVTNLGIGYRGVAVVQDVSFSVLPQEILLIAGPNGSGKSTLLRTLTRQLPPVAGTSKTKARLGSGGMAYVGETALYDQLTVAENVQEAVRLGSGLPDCVRQFHAWRICERLWSRRAGSLSLGEKRWVRIAMALSQGPMLLMLDEPSLNLSPQAIQQMVEDVRSYAIRQNAGVVVADHSTDSWMAARATPYVIDDQGFRRMTKVGAITGHESVAPDSSGR